MLPVRPVFPEMSRRSRTAGPANAFVMAFAVVGLGPLAPPAFAVPRDLEEVSTVARVEAPGGGEPRPVERKGLTVRIAPTGVASTLAFLEKTFKEVMPRFEYRHFFVDDDFRQKYPNEEKARSIYTYFGKLAIFVACLGLFGLASFIIERRTKEIGIRKALGAGVRRIVLLLSGEFLRAVLLANLVAWPLAFFFMDRWLRTFAYRIRFEWWFIVLAAVISVVIAFLTVSYQSVWSARANPVDSLRSAETAAAGGLITCCFHQKVSYGADSGMRHLVSGLDITPHRDFGSISKQPTRLQRG